MYRLHNNKFPNARLQSYAITLAKEAIFAQTK